MTHSPEDPMERYDLLYRLYDEFDTRTVRSYAEFVELFPPVDSRVALEGWNDANTQLRDRKTAIRRRFADAGDTFAELAATATREQAFTALDLLAKYGRTPNVLVLDVDETLRSAGTTDNEIPRETLHLLTQFHEAGIPIVICTGQTLENVKGFLIQGLGNEIVFSGDVSIVYEAGTGVFTPVVGPTPNNCCTVILTSESRPSSVTPGHACSQTHQRIFGAITISKVTNSTSRSSRTSKPAVIGPARRSTARSCI
jgi:Predicted hydrolases of the HAD superfamily